jgi:hypothetical protein
VLASRADRRKYQLEGRRKEGFSNGKVQGNYILCRRFYIGLRALPVRRHNSITSGLQFKGDSTIREVTQVEKRALSAAAKARLGVLPYSAVA